MPIAEAAESPSRATRRRRRDDFAGVGRRVIDIPFPKDRPFALASTKILFGLCVAAAVGGCATYHSMPLTDQALAEELAPPDMQEVRLRAKTLKHPILKPIPFDDRDGLSPDEAAVLAVIANPTLRAVRDRRKIAGAQLLRAGILPNPQLGYSMEIPTGGNDQGKVNALGVGLNWDVRALITREAETAAARLNAASVNLAVAWQEWQVAEKAKLQVYRLILAGKQLKLAKEAERERHRAYRAIRQGTELGERTAFELSAAKAAWQDAKIAVSSALEERERERLALNRALGFPADRVVKLQKGVVIPSRQSPPSPRDRKGGIKERRLDLIALKLGYESQEERVRSAVLAQFPQISIGLSGGRDTDKLRTAGFGVTIGLPFFDRNQGNIAVARATRQQLHDEYLARLFEAQSEISRISAEIRSTRDRIRLVEESLPTLEKLVRSYQEATRNETADILNYYRSLDRLYGQKVKMIRLQRDLADLDVALEIATGKYVPAPNDRQSASCSDAHPPRTCP